MIAILLGIALGGLTAWARYRYGAPHPKYHKGYLAIGIPVEDRN